MVVVLRAMGVESDQEIMSLVGSEPEVAALMSPTLQDARAAGIFVRQQALEYLGTQLCLRIASASPRKHLLPASLALSISDGVGIRPEQHVWKASWSPT